MYVFGVGGERAEQRGLLVSKVPLLLQEKYRENKYYPTGYKYIMCNVNGVLFC